MPTSKESIPEQEAVKAESAEAGKGTGGPLTMLFPPDLSVWGESRKLIGDKNVRVDDLATCASQDPSIVIELLKTSNAMYFSAGRQPITSTRTAIIRLGQDIVLDLLEKMRERPQIKNKDMFHWFETHRSRCKRTSLVARIMSETAAKNLADECQAVGLFLYVGEMLAVYYLEDRYIELSGELSRSGLNYRLAQDLKFDVEKMGLNYLRRQGIPEALLFAIDRDGRSKSTEKAIMKPLCLAAGELVEAFDANRWDKFAPGKTIPPKSALRTLPFTDTQYLKLYERISEYLFTMRVVDERKKQAQRAEMRQAEAEAAASVPEAPSAQDILQSEITTILNEAPDTEEPPVVEKKAEVKKTAAPAPPKKEEKPKPLGRNEAFNLTKSEPKTKARQNRAKVIQPPKMASKTASDIVNSFTDLMNKAENSEELLSNILGMLVDTGPFKKSALIVVSQDRTKALVVAARGPNIGNGQEIPIDDPLNPLAQCFSKVQSFGNKESKCSPFGSKSFALAPIDADHGTPVALYADCGNEGAITFDARRVFRTVVEILNTRLPNIPGGIPIEI